MVMIMEVVLFVVNVDLAFVVCLFVVAALVRVSTRPARALLLSRRAGPFVASVALPSAPVSTNRWILHHGVVRREAQPRVLLHGRRAWASLCYLPVKVGHCQ